MPSLSVTNISRIFGTDPLFQLPVERIALPLVDRNALEIIVENGNYRFQVTCPWGITKVTQNIVITGAPQELADTLTNSKTPQQRDSLISSYLLSQFQQHSGSHKVDNFQIQNRNGQTIVVLTPYGLKGGGDNKDLGILTGLALAGVGVTITILSGGTSLIPAVIGAATLGAGTSGTIYSVVTKEEDINLKDYVVQATVGAATGAVSGGFSSAGHTIIKQAAYEGSRKLFVQTVTSSLAGGAGAITSKVTTNAIKGEKLTTDLTARDIGVGALAGGCASLATSATTKVVNGTLKKLITESADDFAESASKTAKVTIGGFVGGAGGVTGGTTAVAIDELADRHAERLATPSELEAIRARRKNKGSFNKRLKEAAITGGIIGATMGVAQAAQEHEKLQRIKDKIAELERQAEVERETTLQSERETHEKAVEIAKREILNSPEAQQAKLAQKELDALVVLRDQKHASLIDKAIRDGYKIDSGPLKGQKITLAHRDAVLQKIREGEIFDFKVKTGKHDKTISLNNDGWSVSKKDSDGLFKDSSSEKRTLGIPGKQQDAATKQAKVTELLSTAEGTKAPTETSETTRKDTPQTGPKAEEPSSAKGAKVEFTKESDRGVTIEITKGLKVNEAAQPIGDPKNALWDDVKKCFLCSGETYSHNGGNVEGMTKVGHIDYKKYGFDMYAYLDQKNNRLYFGFKGSQAWQQWLIDDVGLLFNGKPDSVNGRISRGIQQIMDAYPTSKPLATGHSLGAAQATAFSSILGIETIGFDNPGLRGSFDDSRVTSFQSLPNGINEVGNRKGNVIQLATETSTKVKLHKIGDLLKPFSSTTKVVNNLPTHKMESIEKSLKRTERLMTRHSKNRTLRNFIKDGSRVKYSNTHSAELERELHHMN